MDGGGPRIVETGSKPAVDDGCVYILETALRCGAGRRPGSAYCDHHHALCHIPAGSRGERRRLRTVEVLAAAVGGKQGRPARTPPEPFLRRLENLARGFSRPECSLNVPNREGK